MFQMTSAIQNIDTDGEDAVGTTKVLHTTLGTSVNGLKYASAAWSTLAFEKPEEQITYNMDIMQHVFLFMVHEKLVRVTDATGKSETMRKYCKVSDSEMCVIKNPTEETVFVANKQKQLDGSNATMMTVMDRPFYLGVEFSGDGKRIFGHCEVPVSDLLRIGASNVNEETPLDQYVSVLNSGKSWSGDFVVPVAFKFGDLTTGGYLIDELYTSIRENPTPVSISMNIVFHRDTFDDGINSVGFSANAYTSKVRMV